MWRVTTFTFGNNPTRQGGFKGGNEWREFDDEPSAHRWAKHVIETTDALTAKVTKLGGNVASSTLQS